MVLAVENRSVFQTLLLRPDALRQLGRSPRSSHEAEVLPSGF